MVKKILDFGIKMYKKYEELVNYLIVGVATTVVYLIACFIFEKFFWDPQIPFENFMINTCSWVVGVIFAYITNRKYVFKSESEDITGEVVKFVAGRLLTWGLDVFIMCLSSATSCESLLHISALLAKFTHRLYKCSCNRKSCN